MGKQKRLVNERPLNRFHSLCNEADNIAVEIESECDIIHFGLQSDFVDAKEIEAVLKKLQTLCHKLAINFEELELLNEGTFIPEYPNKLHCNRKQLHKYRERISQFENKYKDMETSAVSGVLQEEEVAMSDAGSATIELSEALQKQAELVVKSRVVERKKELKKRQIDIEAELESLDIQTELNIVEAKLSLLGPEPRGQEPDQLVSQSVILDDIVVNNEVLQDKECGRYNMRGRSMYNEKPKGACRLNNNGLCSRTSEMDEMLVKALKKPNVEMKVFKGEPTEFKIFMRQFEAKVSQYCSSVEEELNYLLQFTEGEPHNIVRGFSYLPAEIGFRAAMDELSNRYGNSDVIAAKYIRQALDWPIIKIENAKALDEFSIFMTEIDYAMGNLDSVRVLENPENIRRLMDKLPFQLQDRWRARVFSIEEDQGIVRFKDFAHFIRCESKKANHPIYGKVLEPRATGAKTYATTETVVEGCPYCKEDHVLNECSKFSGIPHDAKMSLVSQQRRCFKCLQVGHVSKGCKNVERCAHCSGAHPSVMHIFRVTNVVQQTPNVASSNKINQVEGAGCTLAIVPVKIRKRNSLHVKTVLAFLDPGSTTSFISENLKQELDCYGPRRRMDLSTMGSVHTMYSHSIRDLEIIGVEGDVISLPNVYTKENIPVDCSFKVNQEDIDKWPHLKHMNLPDCSGEVSILLGNNVPGCMVPLELQRGPEGAPYAVRTRLGWVVWGLVKENEKLVSCKASVEAIREVDINRLDGRIVDCANYEFPEKMNDDQKEMSVNGQEFVKKTNESMSVVLLLMALSVVSFMALSVVFKPVRGQYEMDFTFEGDSIKLSNSFAHAHGRYDTTVIERNFKHMHIDDLLTSLDQEGEAKVFIKEFNNLCSQDEFIPKDLCNNERRAVETVAKPKRSKGLFNLDFEKDRMLEERALGLWWCMETDFYAFTVNIDQARTRRQILSVINSIYYDPMGMVNPFILPTELLLQHLCKLNLGWDEVVDQVGGKGGHENICERCNEDNWYEENPNLEMGDVVMLVEPNVKGCYYMARVVKTYEDKNGLVMTVMIKSKDGIFKRPVVRLCFLLKYNSQDDVNLP